MTKSLNALDSPRSSDMLALARTDLMAYGVAQVRGFKAPPHLLIVADYLEALERRERRRVIFCMPPRHGKTLLSFELFPSWYLGRNPSHQIIAITYSQELTEDSGRRVRNFISHPRHSAIFPRCMLSTDSTAMNRFATTEGGAYYGVGRSSPIVGRGADLILIDDLFKDGQEARSPATRRAIRDFYGECVHTRLMPGGVIAICGTRWHEDDLIGSLLRNDLAEGWELVSFAGIAERDESFRKEGEALWDGRFPLSYFENERRVLRGSFAAIIMQRPVPSDGGVFKAEWFRSYSVLAPLRRVIVSWDTAFKEGVEHDYSACTVWGEAADGFYLLHVWRGRIEFPELKRRVTEVALAWQATAVLIEDSGSGQPLSQELKRGSRLPIIPVKPRGNKLARANAVSAVIESGRVLLPAQAEWKEMLMDELLMFPAGSHDDLVDSVTQALIYLQEGPDEASIAECFRIILNGNSGSSGTSGPAAIEPRPTLPPPQWRIPPRRW